jgi:hypothetical protein
MKRKGERLKKEEKNIEKDQIQIHTSATYHKQ